MTGAGLKYRKRILTAVSGAILVGGVGVTMYLNGAWQPNFPDIKTYSIRGIDVSHHQGPIDWTEVAKDRVDFVYIKATEGGDWVDTRFRQNWNESG
jgi:lysozyme